MRVGGRTSLEQIRQHVQHSLRTLRPDHKRSLNPTPYKVVIVCSVTFIAFKKLNKQIEEFFLTILTYIFIYSKNSTNKKKEIKSFFISPIYMNEICFRYLYPTNCTSLSISYGWKMHQLESCPDQTGQMES